MPTPETLPYPAVTTTGALLIVAGLVLLLAVGLRRMNHSAETVVTPQFILSIIIVFGFVSVTAYSVRSQLPEGEASGQLLGGLISGFTMVLSYWFGPRRNGS